MAGQLFVTLTTIAFRYLNDKFRSLRNGFNFLIIQPKRQQHAIFKSDKLTQFTFSFFSWKGLVGGGGGWAI